MDASAATSRPSRMNEIGEESRRRLLDAAEALFISHGVSDTSFTMIERKAGISRGSISWHFKNKLGLLSAVVDRATLMTALKPPEHQGRAGLDEVLDYAHRNTDRPQADLLVFLIAESFRDGSTTHDQFRGWHKEIRRSLAEIVAQRPDETPLPPGVDADAFAAILMGAFIGIHQQSRLAPELVDSSDCFRALKLLLDALFDRPVHDPEP